MRDLDELIAFLLKQIGMDAQSASAMTHAIANLQSRWSPARLLADSESKRQLVGYALEPDDKGDIDSNLLKLLALPYAHVRGYKESWRP